MKNIDLNSGSVANIDEKGSISQTKIINTGKYLQFLYNYQIDLPLNLRNILYNMKINF